jgi:hypothetical protein
VWLQRVFQLSLIVATARFSSGNLRATVKTARVLEQRTHFCGQGIDRRHTEVRCGDPYYCW